LRMRKKPNLIPRMERCQTVWVQEPERWKGVWRRQFKHADAPLRVELGCGKGQFTIGLAEQNPDILYVAIERVPEAMVMAMERAMQQELSNVCFVSEDVAQISKFFERHEIERIYINFCDPWPGKKHAKRRLTSERFLQLYDPLLQLGGQIHFKTDNQPLFAFSLEEFERCGYALSEVTYDLHADGPVGCMTDYEEKFWGQGIPICRCIATKIGEMTLSEGETEEKLNGKVIADFTE
jgi:tRNA (guanine-N7-)-methyltransferase